MIRLVLIIICCLNLNCKIKTDTFKIIIKSKIDKNFQILITENDIDSVKWNMQEYYLSKNTLNLINKNIKTISFSKSYMDFYINDIIVSKAGIGCLCAPITEHLGTNFPYFYIGCLDKFVPNPIDNRLKIFNPVGNKDYAFNEKVYKTLKKKNKLK
jgi:hypothetical protein